MSEQVSVIIPIYNEEKSIESCIASLKGQSYQNMEIILVDDGSTDNTLKILESIDGIKLLHQKHKGPGTARNLGAQNTESSILVFVDADMTFDGNFIKDLVTPIVKGETIGTFSKNEMVKNENNNWSICWNINRNVPKDRMLPDNYPNMAPVFRAIKKSEFDRVSGFETSGQYTDDWSLSRKLNIQSTAVSGALYYHFNPASLKEVYKQARWIGKNEFISGTPLRRIRSLILYSLAISLLIGIYKSVVQAKLLFIFFKLVYDWAVFSSVVECFFSKNRAKP